MLALQGLSFKYFWPFLNFLTWNYKCLGTELYLEG